MLRVLAVDNYRSLRDLVVDLGRITVVTGPNGSGKSSLYRSLRLLAETARGGAVAALAREGGLPSVLWAGPGVIGTGVRSGRHPVEGTRRAAPQALRVGFAGSDFGYAVDFGLPTTGSTGLFGLDPEIKRECVWSGPVLRPATLLTDRSGPHVRTRPDEGGWLDDTPALRPSDSVLTELADPRRTPELLALRDRIRAWRFYDQLRTDATAPARVAQVGTRTPVLAADGSDLAAALQTIVETGDAAALHAAVDRAFPGSSVAVTAEGGRFDLLLRQPGLLRPLRSAELSDGTLRFLLWTAALLSPRPPELVVLNEPESSLHPDLLPALGDLLAMAARRTQVVAVTHSTALAVAVAAAAGDLELRSVELGKQFGETAVAGQDRLDRPSWTWPRR